MSSILEKNLKKMTGYSNGEMLYLIAGESIGGNAGHWNNYPCVAANFRIDSKTGEIKYFECIQHIPKEILNNSKAGVLRLAVDIKKTCKFYIVNYKIDRCTKNARSNIEDTVKTYNKKYGFKPKISN